MHPLTGCHRAVASPLKPVRPSQESRTESEGLDPPSGHSVVTEPPLQRNSASTSGPTSPAVKTSSPCLPPRGADRAVGGIRTEVENSGRRARATHDSTPIPTIRPKSQQFVATATLPRRARQVPTVGCSGATQEPASSRATTCHPVVLGLDPAMVSRRSRPARTNAFETGARACMPADCGHMRSAANAAETCIHLTTQLVRGRLRDALSAGCATLIRAYRRERLAEPTRARFPRIPGNSASHQRCSSRSLAKRVWPGGTLGRSPVLDYACRSHLAVVTGLHGQGQRL